MTTKKTGTKTPEEMAALFNAAKDNPTDAAAPAPAVDPKPVKPAKPARKLKLVDTPKPDKPAKATKPAKAGTFTPDEDGSITVGPRRFSSPFFTSLITKLADKKAHALDDLAATAHAAVGGELAKVSKQMGVRLSHIRTALTETPFELARPEKGIYRIVRRGTAKK